ncbi:hypothetical protein J6590_067510 [Homalodisca vitripennis]|nr:hypothetical protein J6590_067510 [Homalodisca vitripennis]
MALDLNSDTSGTRAIGPFSSPIFPLTRRYNNLYYLLPFCMRPGASGRSSPPSRLGDLGALPHQISCLGAITCFRSVRDQSPFSSSLWHFGSLFLA